MNPQAILFYLLGGIAVLSALMVILQRNPVHSAIYLIVSFLAVAGIYVTLEAEFLAAVQVLVYAGGIVVLFLFVIMLVQLESARAGRMSRLSLSLVILLVVLLVGSFLFVYQGAGTPAAQGGDLDQVFRAGGGNLQAVGQMLYRSYLLPFEIASILLLVAMVGAVILARSDG